MNSEKWLNLTQRQWQTELQVLLVRSDTALERAIVAIYKRQTPYEKAVEGTVITNGIGFNRFDAELMSKLAKQIISGTKLTKKQLYIARKKMPKYWRQLMDISKGKLNESI